MKHYTEARYPEVKATLEQEGPWQDEPDKATWYDQTTDMACMIVRNPSGALCGYVGVEPDHPWYGKYEGQCTLENPGIECHEHTYCNHSPSYLTTVHGGLTYADRCQEDGKICHVPAPLREHDVWWFGFDCSHGWDYQPKTGSYRGGFGPMSKYRDWSFVMGEVTSLAATLSLGERGEGE